MGLGNKPNATHPLEDISQLSGHKNINSLKSYHSASIEKQQEMSRIVSNDFSSNLPNSQSLLDSSNALPNSGCLFSSSQSAKSLKPLPMFKGSSFSNCTFN